MEVNETVKHQEGKRFKVKYGVKNFLVDYKRLVCFVLAFFCVGLITASVFNQKNSNKDRINTNGGEISAGGTFYNCLIEEGMSPQHINMVGKALSKLYDVRVCSPGDKYEIESSSSGVFLGFRLYHGIYVYSVEKDSFGVYGASSKKIPMQEKTAGISGTIQDNMWSAMIRQGLTPDLIMRFADIFSWQIDFLTETRKGDRYKLVWTRYSNDKGNIIDGKIFAAMYEGRESGTYTAIIFENKYYDISGKSLQKQFYRAPLNYRRISSFFTIKRFHPILRYYRPHTGIDYSAQTGTPVVSIGDGSVTYCGWKGQSGKTVIIKHNSIYITSYSHLSRFGKGIRAGSRVRQGQVIGYVGSTGLSTGPHLDFRIKKYGKFVNFLKLNIPPSESVKADRMGDYSVIKKKRLTHLALVFKENLIFFEE